MGPALRPSGIQIYPIFDGSELYNKMRARLLLLQPSAEFRPLYDVFPKLHLSQGCLSWCVYPLEFPACRFPGQVFRPEKSWYSYAARVI